MAKHGKNKLNEVHAQIRNGQETHRDTRGQKRIACNCTSSTVNLTRLVYLHIENLDIIAVHPKRVFPPRKGGRPSSVIWCHWPVFYAFRVNNSNRNLIAMTSSLEATCS